MKYALIAIAALAVSALLYYWYNYNSQDGGKWTSPLPGLGFCPPGWPKQANGLCLKKA